MKKTQPTVLTPSKPKIVEESENKGIYEIDGLYPGYGHTLGNSLRRIILSSLPGVAVTGVKIDGVSHEFSTVEGIKEDVINILLNIKKMRMILHTEEPQSLSISKEGEGELTAADLSKSNSAVEIVNPELHIATLTDKKSSINMEITVERGLGFVTKEEMKKEKTPIGTIALDAVFTPIRKVTYEVENMRVGDRTDFNKLIISIETDKTISPREALEESIYIMIEQLKAVVGFQEKVDETELYDVKEENEDENTKEDDKNSKEDKDLLKTPIKDLDLSSRTSKAISTANIRTVSGLIRKSEEDLKSLDGLGEKGVQEIKELLEKEGLSLKDK